MLIAILELLPKAHLTAMALAVLGRILVKLEPELHLVGPLSQTVALRVRLPRNIRGSVRIVNEPPPLAPPAYLNAINIAGRPPQLPPSCIVEMTPIRTAPKLFLTLRLFPGRPPVEFPVDDRESDMLAVLLTVPSVVDRTVRATMTVNIDSIVVITVNVPLCPPLWNALINVITVRTMLTKLKTVVTPPTTGTKSSMKLSVLNIMLITLNIASFPLLRQIGRSGGRGRTGRRGVTQLSTTAFLL